MFHQFEELHIKSSQLKSCFYCEIPLPASEKEHIFNASWGGSHPTGDLICDKCNKGFSKKVDKAFLIYTGAVMNAWSFKGKRHPSIPTIGKENDFIKLKGNYFLDAGAKLRLKKPLIEEEKQSDGLVRSKISFNSRGEAKRWLLEQPLSQEKRNSLEQQIRQAKFRSEDPQPQEASVTLNLREQYRSAAHTILKCLGFFMPDWVCHDQTKQVRQFARYGEGDWLLFAVEVEQHFSLADQAISLLGLGVNHNSVEIYWSSYLRMVIGVVTILNRVKRAVVISKDYVGTDRVLYVFEDTHGSGKPPRAISAEINSQEFSAPTIGIQYFASPSRINEVFRSEILELTATYYPIDALTAKLKEEIEEINQKNLEVSDKICEEYREAFLKFFVNWGKILQISVDKEQLCSKLSDYGFADLAHRFTGRTCNDKEFKLYVAKIFDNILMALK
ncbi:HNH endonuclease [Floridanema aerugineum]|uniref:HNH endonuclease n=1 Tax=Floridaenema aerugineum BLCC-F46 TaxID=3153654 RepID=A0ABV4X443_9CYAN